MCQPSVRGLKQIIAWETFCISHNARHVWMGTPQPSTWSQLMVRPYHCQPTEPAEVQPQKSNANHKNLKKEHQKYYGQNEITSKWNNIKTSRENEEWQPWRQTSRVYSPRHLRTMWQILQLRRRWTTHLSKPLQDGHSHCTEKLFWEQGSFVLLAPPHITLKCRRQN